MELKFILGALSTVILGLITNYFWDKIKNHSSTANRRSGFDFEFLIRLKIKK